MFTSLKSFITESDSAIVGKIKSSIEKVLDSKDYTVMVRTSNLGGSTSYFLDVYHTKVKVTRHNSPLWTAIAIDSDNDKVTATSDIYPKREGINFRKISANSFDDVINKLSVWFKNNKPTYDKILSTVNN